MAKVELGLMSQFRIAPYVRLSIKHEAIIPVTGNWIHMKSCSIIIYIHVNLWFNQGIQFHLPWIQMSINVHHFIRVFIRVNLLVIVECQGFHSLLAHRCPHIGIKASQVCWHYSHTRKM